MFKVSRGLSPEVVNGLFQFREQIHYELRQRRQFQIPWFHSVFSGTESVNFFGSKIWAMVPNKMKHLESLGNLHPVPADYAKHIFIGLIFFNKKLF